MKPERTGIRNRTLIWLLGALMPLAILALLWVIGISQFYLLFGAVLWAFVLMHVVAMIGMRKKG